MAAMRILLVVAILVLACGASQSDRDFDQIPDARDRCPDDAEDLDGFHDEDGCYDGDNDQDGIADAPDLCPQDAEDLDGFEDEDGCPDPDDDQDRILDIDDQCPREAEVYNGLEDEDGCPDVGRVVVHEHIHPVHERVFFDHDATRVLERSAPILEAVAATMLGNPEMERVALVGAATTDEPAELAMQRANAVRDLLLGLGITAERLQTFAAPARDPASDANHPDGASLRHVEFRVLRVDGRDVARWSGTAIERIH